MIIERDKEMLRKLHNAGVKLRVKGARIYYDPPRGGMTDALKAALDEVRTTVIFEHLQGRSIKLDKIDL